MSKTSKPKIDYDGKWKKLIEQYPQLFIDFFLQEIYEKIDFSETPTMIMQDLAKVISDSKKKGDKVTDLVIQVLLKTGEKRLLYIHIEVQSSWVKNFAEKMYIPFYRLRDKYRQEVTAFALFVGDTIPTNPGIYQYEFGKTFVNFGYPYYICKNKTTEELLATKNPFAIAVLACKFLAEQKRKKDYPKLLEQKILLMEKYVMEQCAAWGVKDEVLFALNDFIFNLVLLPEEQEKELTKRYQKFTNVMNQPTAQDRYSPEFIAEFTRQGLSEQIWQLKEEQKEKRLAYEQLEKEILAAKKQEQLAKKKAEEQEQLAKKKEQKAKEKIIAAEKKAKTEKLKSEKQLKDTIIALSAKAGFDNAKIAEILNLKITEVALIIKAYNNKKAK